MLNTLDATQPDANSLFPARWHHTNALPWCNLFALKLYSTWPGRTCNVKWTRSVVWVAYLSKCPNMNAYIYIYTYIHSPSHLWNLAPVLHVRPVMLWRGVILQRNAIFLSNMQRLLLQRTWFWLMGYWLLWASAQLFRENTIWRLCFFEKDTSSLWYAVCFKYSIAVSFSMMDIFPWQMHFPLLRRPFKKDTSLKVAIICFNSKNNIVAEYEVPIAAEYEMCPLKK